MHHYGQLPRINRQFPDEQIAHYCWEQAADLHEASRSNIASAYYSIPFLVLLPHILCTMHNLYFVSIHKTYLTFSTVVLSDDIFCCFHITLATMTNRVELISTMRITGTIKAHAKWVAGFKKHLGLKYNYNSLLIMCDKLLATYATL